MAARRRLLSLALFAALLPSCKARPAIPPTVALSAPDAAPDSAPDSASRVSPAIDNAISDCVEVMMTLDEPPKVLPRIKLRFTVTQPIYRCGCPSAVVRYTLIKRDKIVASADFGTMKYTDRWYETLLPLATAMISEHVVTVGCNVQ